MLAKGNLVQKGYYLLILLIRLNFVHQRSRILILHHSTFFCRSQNSRVFYGDKTIETNPDLFKKAISFLIHHYMTSLSGIIIEGVSFRVSFSD